MYIKAFIALTTIPIITKLNKEDSIKSLNINSLLQKPAKGGIPARDNSIILSAIASNLLCSPKLDKSVIYFKPIPCI